MLLPLAAGVAYARVYLGVHYPSDVIVGAAIGTAFGLAARPAAQRLGIDSGEAPDSTSTRSHAALRGHAASARTAVREAPHATASKLAIYADAADDDSCTDRTTSTDV